MLQPHPDLFEGNLDRFVVERVRRSKFLPDLECGTRLPDHLAERSFRVIAPPAAGLMKFDKMIETLLRQHSPANDNAASQLRISLRHGHIQKKC